MSTTAFLQDLVLARWRFWLEDGKLKYRAPRDAVTPALLDRLKVCKAELVHLLETAPETLDLCPLSYGQRALWFLWALAPDSSAYNLSLPLHLPAGSAEAEWREACTALVRRHPMLRTVFPRRGNDAVQEVRPAGVLDWAAADASHWSNDRLTAGMADAHQAPFDLERGPVVRFRWFGRGEGGAVLLITMHHIASDGWSLEVIRRELPFLHAQARTGGAALPPPAIIYHDHVHRQLDLLSGEKGERLWAFWRDRLAEPLPVLALPTDLPRPAVKTYDGDACPLPLPDGLGGRVKALAQQAGATPYAAFLAAFLVLLHRITGQDDVLVGSPQTGRGQADCAGVVGYFVDPVVVRSRLTEGRRFRDFLEEVRRVSREALDHADFPFALLVERLRVERDPGRSPLFDASFNYLAAPPPGEGAPPLDVLDIAQADGKFDLSLTIRDAGAEVAGALGYNTSLFRRDGAERLAAMLATVLEAVVEDPDRLVEDIPLDGQKRGEPALSGPRRAVEPAQMVHRLFAAHAAAAPDAPAVEAEDGALTHAELDRRANGLAHHLRKCGVGPDVTVGIAATRSAGFVVALLAVLKAGGAYVPLDPAYPPDLRRAMIAQAGVRVVLTGDARRGAWAELGVDALGLESFFARSDSRAEEPPADTATLDSLAYVIFTSGSTGIPKGVAVEHRALANYVQSMLVDLPVEGRLRFALVSTLAADLGHTMLFPSLCSGGCLHLLPEAAGLDGGLFAEYMRAHAIDALKIVPSHFAALVDGAGGAPPMPRRLLVLGGEGASPAWIERLRQAPPGCRILNHYGPTETTVGVLTGLVEPEGAPPATATLPLRRPTANTDIHILDARGRPVPRGLTGELHIGGACLARGYINAPELTDQSFVTIDGQRLYRTGDLARRMPDGSLELLGRRDRQLKIRGHRIELGQVEAALRATGAVRQCAVLPDADGAAARQLVACAVPTPEEPRDEQARHRLLRRLERALPAHMVPGRLLFLDALPLTANGKLDVKALRSLAGDESKPDGTPAEPRDLVELDLARIWAEVLELPRVGITDDFFQLGGHSLLAVRLAGRIQERFKRRISLATLFTCPTIEKLAENLRASSAGAEIPVLVPIRPAVAQVAKPPLFLLPGAGGNVLYFSALCRMLDADQPCYGLQALGMDDGSPVPTRIEEIAARYVAIIRRDAQPEGPYRLAGHSFGALVGFEMARQLQRQGQEVAFLGLIDNAAPAVEGRSPDSQKHEGWTHGDWLRHIGLRIGKLFRTRIDLGDGFDALDPDAQTAHLIDRIIAARLLPAALDKAHFARFIDIYKANVVAASRYRPDPLDRPAGVVLFRAADEDAELSRDDRAAGPDLGWSPYVPGPLPVVATPGTHLTMFLEPQVDGLAERMNDALRRLR
ncbi:amino acid adenylation domain-containing protein [Azospirillum sp. sgz302134]